MLFIGVSRGFLVQGLGCPACSVQGSSGWRCGEGTGQAGCLLHGGDFDVCRGAVDWDSV